MNIELRHIHKHFGKVHANDDIVLNIPAGTIQGILGENGAGKSTLMKILSGFIQADSGRNPAGWQSSNHQIAGGCHSIWHRHVASGSA